MPACQGNGQFSLLGYTTEPNYNRAIHTVYVPVFQNLTLRRGWEFDLTRAVIREIEAKTPYKVVSNREAADTELTGTIIGIDKLLVNRNQLNEVREAEMTLTVEVIWRDLHTGEILSGRSITPGEPIAPAIGPIEPLGPGAAPPAMGVSPATQPLTPEIGPPLPPPEEGVVPPVQPPVLVQSIATFIPELGESITTASKFNVDRLAVQIVSMMEAPW